MRDTLDPAASRRVEISVEDAARPSELELEAAPFADLERRRSEPLDQVGGGQPNQLAEKLG
jgi:hypothetical protein